MHDLIRLGPLDRGKVQRGKSVCEEKFAQETFELNKWHSKVKELGIAWKEGTTLLSLQLGKDSDAISAIFPSKSAWPTTKRIILSKLATIYDPLGLASLITLVGGGKLLYCNTYDVKQTWDAKTLSGFVYIWFQWEERLQSQVSLPRWSSYKP